MDKEVVTHMWQRKTNNELTYMWNPNDHKLIEKERCVVVIGGAGGVGCRCSKAHTSRYK